MPAIPLMTELTDVAVDDLTLIVDDPAGTPITKRATVANLLKLVWPVGSVFVSVVNTNPATLLGFGTWASIATGRTLVGIDVGDPDFDAPEKLSGAKTHTLTTAQIPSHTHIQDAHAHAVTDPGHTHLTQRYPTATGALTGFTIDTSMSGALADNTQPVKSSTTGLTVNNQTAVNQSAGGGVAHPIVQPSLAVYIWKRTA